MSLFWLASGEIFKYPWHIERTRIPCPEGWYLITGSSSRYADRFFLSGTVIGCNRHSQALGRRGINLQASVLCVVLWNFSICAIYSAWVSVMFFCCLGSQNRGSSSLYSRASESVIFLYHAGTAVLCFLLGYNVVFLDSCSGCGRMYAMFCDASRCFLRGQSEKG
jgi:hypothetical protein